MLESDGLANDMGHWDVPGLMTYTGAVVNTINTDQQRILYDLLSFFSVVLETLLHLKGSNHCVCVSGVVARIGVVGEI